MHESNREQSVTQLAPGFESQMIGLRHEIGRAGSTLMMRWETKGSGASAFVD